MALFRLDITKQNCLLCSYFRRDSEAEADPNEGSCTATAPRARGAVDGTVNGGTQDMVNAHVAFPSLTVCGKYKPWEQAAREILPVLE